MPVIAAAGESLNAAQGLEWREAERIARVILIARCDCSQDKHADYIGSRNSGTQRVFECLQVASRCKWNLQTMYTAQQPTGAKDDIMYRIIPVSGPYIRRLRPDEQVLTSIVLRSNFDQEMSSVGDYARNKTATACTNCAVTPRESTRIYQIQLHPILLLTNESLY